MIVIDTSVWVDHFHAHDPAVFTLLQRGEAVQHPYVTGELAMGNLRNWATTVSTLRLLPQLEVLADDAFYAFFELAKLAGTGVGFVDAHLLAAIALNHSRHLWTRDRQLQEQAERLGIAYI